MQYLEINHLDRYQISSLFKNIFINEQSGCWEWLGTINGRGYGKTRITGENEYSHRIIYSWLINKIPKGKGRDNLVVDHICKNKACCNPTHLRLISNLENIKLGRSLPVMGSKKTHCVRGHKLPDVLGFGNGSRGNCPQCDVIRERNYYYKNRDRINKIRRERYGISQNAASN